MTLYHSTSGDANRPLPLDLVIPVDRSTLETDAVIEIEIRATDRSGDPIAAEVFEWLNSELELEGHSVQAFEEVAGDRVGFVREQDDLPACLGHILGKRSFRLTHGEPGPRMRGGRLWRWLSEVFG